MKGNKSVIGLLNRALNDELQAINQYMLHHSILENIGHPKLAAYVRKEAIDEMRHAERLIQRILFLEGDPILAASKGTVLDKDPESILKRQRDMEEEAVSFYRDAAAKSHEASDFVTRALFESLLTDEEGHYDWLDTQLGLIKRLGFANYEASLINPVTDG